MKQGGRGPLGVIVVVAIVLVASLGGLFAYSKLSAKNDTAYAGVLGIAEDTGKTVIYNNGEITDIPDNTVIVGGMTTTWGMLSDSLANAGNSQNSSESGTKTDDKENNVPDEGNGQDEDSSLQDNTDTKQDADENGTSDTADPEPSVTQVPENPPKNSIEAFKDSFIESASTALAYFDNKQYLFSIFDTDDEKKQSAESGEDIGQLPEGSESGEVLDEQEEENIEFLTIYYQGTYDPSVALIQERLMLLGFMENAEPTELYGPATMDAIMRFQRQNDLKQDGILGEQTIGLLFNDNAKSYLLKKGFDGDDIKRIQRRLYELGYLAKSELITGHFGDDTEAAVKSFQSANGLTVDGKVGVMSFELLYSESVKSNVISLNDKSDVVLECQKRLKDLGYLTTTPDGFYGADTLAAVKQFQSRNDCIVDGFLGPSTREILMSGNARPNGLVLGDSNDTVKKVQQLLIKYGYLGSGNDTGYFGEKTEDAVKKFQQKNGLTADGNVGQKTMSVLTGNSVVKAGSGSGGSGSGNGGSGNGGSGSGNGGSGSGNGGSSDDGGKKITYNKSPEDLVKVARSKKGCKYVWGNKGPNTFDCSGFVYWCLNAIGINKSYQTSSEWAKETKYKKITNFDSIKKGDIIVVTHHVGIAAGNGVVIDASSSNGKVVERTMGKWWRNNFICAFRIFD